jgi:hypothetical protein
MQEQRQSPRKVADHVLEIHDQITGNVLGRIVNISAEGFMLLSQEPMLSGTELQDQAESVDNLYRIALVPD